VTIWIRRAALAALLVVPFAAVSTAAAASTDEAALAARFAPVVRLVNQPQSCGPGEPYVPIDVNLLFDEPTVALRGPWGPNDLVKVAPMARPPVVKIMDYGKFKFEEAKAARAAKKKQHIIQLKEVKYRPGIDDHDFDFKTRHAREFLGDGNKVKVTMMFRGRQIAHLELGRAVLDRVAASLADVGKIEADAKLEGRNMTMVLAPK